MTNIYFEKIGDNTVRTIANKNTVLDFFVENEECQEILINGYAVEACGLDGVYVGFNDEVISIQNLIPKAILAFTEICAEEEQDGEDYERTIKSLSRQGRFV
jgi:hypothetical protein